VPYFPNMSEVIDQPLYDKERMDDTVVSLFTTPLGQRGKTYAETNMYTAGMLPAPTKFQVCGLRCTVLIGDNLIAARPCPLTHAVWYTSYVELRIGSKWYFNGTLSEIADPLMFMGNEFMTLAPALRWAIIGRLKRSLARRISINPQESFRVAIYQNEKRPNFWALVHLDGDQYRGIQ